MNRQSCQIQITPETALEILVHREMKRKQVGILGGNFNPVHLTHLIIADQVGNQLALDRVDLMPSYLPPHIDKKQTIDAEHRLNMVNLAVESNPYLGVETLEIDRKGRSYTYDTLKILKEQHPDTDYYFIIGGDMVEYLPKWKNVDKLFNLAHFVGVKRPNFVPQTDYPIIWVDVPMMYLSSSEIRKKIQTGCSVNYLLPQNVLKYIHEKGLYQNE